MTTLLALDLFAGPGGWSQGARYAGVKTIGFEWCPWACATAHAAGHTRVRADVAAYPATRTRQFEQVGNAVPPPLAAAVVGAVA